MTRKLILLISMLCCIASSNTFAQGSRLVAIKHNNYNNYIYPWAPTHLYTIVYSNNRGGDLTDYQQQNLKYDSLLRYYWNGSSYIADRKTTHTFDQQNRIIEEVNADVYDYLFSRTQMTYNNNGDLLEHVSQTRTNNSWVNTSKYIRTYDGNHNMLSYEWQIWDAANNVWDNQHKLVYTYNQDNSMTSVMRLYPVATTNLYDTGSKKFYHYTNNLNDTILEMQWDNNVPTLDSRTINYYQGNIKTHSLRQVFDGNAWNDAALFFVLLHGVDNIYAGDSIVSWNQNTNSWYLSGYNKYTIDNNGDAVEHIKMIYNSTLQQMVNFQRDSMAYNTFHQKTWHRTATWLNNTWNYEESSSEAYYYYEEYTTDVNTAIANTSKVDVYPSPARDNINIRAVFNDPEDFIVTVHDMQGRLVFQMGEKATANYQRNISLPDVASGNYIIQIKGRNISAQQQFTIVK